MKREVSNQSSIVPVIAIMVLRGPELPGSLSQIPDPQKTKRDNEVHYLKPRNFAVIYCAAITRTVISGRT